MANWPRAEFGEFLRANSRPHTLGPEEDANLLGVRWYGDGPFHRELKPAIQIAKKTHFVVKAGDVIYNKLFAWKGSFGIVPPEFDGMFVSDKFPTYELDRTRVDERFLWWFFHYSPLWDEARIMSTGSAAISKLTLNPPKFLRLTMPCPPLPEQRRVANRLDELSGQIRGATSVREQAVDESRVLVRGVTTKLVDDAGWETQLLGDLLIESPRNGLSPRPPVEKGGRPMLRINAVSSASTRFVDLTATKRVEVTDEEAKPFTLQRDDVFIVRYNGDINRVAKAAIYKAADESRVVFPDKLMRLRPKPTKMLPDFLVYALSAQSVRDQVEGLGKTTAGNIGVSGANAKSFIVSVPPIPEQIKIVTNLDALQAEVDALQQLQAETTAEINGLMPTILDRAFKTEL